MGKDVWEKLKTNPGAFLKKIVKKLIVEPARYRRGDDYDAEGYWRKRFEIHGAKLTGPGDEGLSEQGNERMYREAADKVLEILRDHGISLAAQRVLEIGCGNGFFTGIFHDRGVRDYLGVDITDAQFAGFHEKWPDFKFVKMDITAEAPAGLFDVVFLIDVIQHIVTESKLAAAFEHVKTCLRPGGLLLLSPVSDKSDKHLFYVHWWSLRDIKKHFADCEISELIPFRYSHLLAIRAKSWEPSGSFTKS